MLLIRNMFVSLFLFPFVAGCATPQRPSPDFGQPLPLTVNTEILPQSPATVAPQTTTPKARDLVSLLEGCVIIADDGQFLGVISKNEFSAESIINQFGKYGSEFSTTSIFNEFAKYGGEISRLSPYSEITSSPPRIFTPRGTLIGYLTKNPIKTPNIDPHFLIALLKSQ
jgi:hypothetical protein